MLIDTYESAAQGSTRGYSAPPPYRGFMIYTNPIRIHLTLSWCETSVNLILIARPKMLPSSSRRVQWRRSQDTMLQKTNVNIYLAFVRTILDPCQATKLPRYIQKLPLNWTGIHHSCFLLAVTTQPSCVIPAGNVQWEAD